MSYLPPCRKAKFIKSKVRSKKSKLSSLCRHYARSGVAMTRSRKAGQLKTKNYETMKLLASGCLL